MFRLALKLKYEKIYVVSRVIYVVSHRHRHPSPITTINTVAVFELSILLHFGALHNIFKYHNIDEFTLVLKITELSGLF